MASINDVFNALNDIKGKLDVLHGDETTTAGKIDTSNTRLSTINTSVNAVGNRLEARLVDIRDRQDDTNAVLLHETRQLETVICALDAISDGVCTLISIATRDSAQLANLVEFGRVTAEIAQTANPAAALELQRRDTAAAAIAACCPPDPEEPACTHERCQDPGPFHAKEPKRDPIG